MLDRVIRRVIDPALDRLGAGLASYGTKADQVTLVGFAFGIAAAIAVASGQFAAALVLFTINRIMDGIDGAVARASHISDRGGFLDVMADFGVYGAIPLAFAYHAPTQNALSAAVLLFCFYVNGASFLAYAALEAKHRMSSKPVARKSFYYSAGLMEGTETIIFFSVMLAVPRQFAVLALVFAALTLLTAVMRCSLAWTTFSKPN
jgi:phosphatidylglycerophosphate synthase